MADYLDTTDFGKAINFGQPTIGIDPAYTQDYSGLMKGFAEAMSGASKQILENRAIQAEERKVAEQERKKFSESQYLGFENLTNPNVKTDIIGQEPELDQNGNQKKDGQGKPVFKQVFLTTDQALLKYNSRVDEMMKEAPRANFMVYDDNGNVIGAAETKEQARGILGDREGNIERGDGSLYISDKTKQLLAQEKFRVLAADKKITQDVNLKDARSKATEQALTAVRNMNVDGNAVMAQSMKEFTDYIKIQAQQDITDYGQDGFTPDVAVEIQRRQNDIAAKKAAIDANEQYAQKLVASTMGQGAENINKDETLRIAKEIAKENTKDPLALQAKIANGEFQPVERYDSGDVFKAIAGQYKSTKKTSTKDVPLSEDEIIKTIDKGIKEKDPVYVGYFGSTPSQDQIKATAKDYINANTQIFPSSRTTTKKEKEAPKTIQSEMIAGEGGAYTLAYGNDSELLTVKNTDGTPVQVSISTLDFDKDGNVVVNAKSQDGAFMTIPYDQNKGQIMASVRKRFGVESLSDLKREFERKKAEDEKTAQEIFNASE
jgi:hypothetical protein